MVKLLIHFLLLENIEIVLAECINIAQKDHILALNSLVGIRVDLLAFPQRRSHMFNILLHGLTHVSLLLVQVCLADLVFIGLLEHVDSMQALDALLQLLVVIQVIIEHLVDLVLELLFVVILLTNLLNRLLHLLLHALALKSHVPDDQAQVLIDDEEVLRLSVHLGLLLLQALDDLHARPDSALKLLDLVVKHKLELLELLRLLAILVNLVLLVLDCLLPLLQLVLHALDVRLLELSLGDLGVQVRILLLNLLLQVISLLLVVAILVADQGQLTLLLHALVDLHSQFGLVFLLDRLDILPSLILDLLSVLLMVLHHLFYLLRQRLLLRFEVFALEHLVTAQLFHEALVSQISLAHEVLKLVQVVLLLLLELLVAVHIRLALLLLVTRLCFEHFTVSLHLMVDFLFVAPLHITGVLFNFLHSLSTFRLFFLHLAAKVLSLLFILEHESRLAFLPVSLLSLDRFLQVSNLLLQLISLLFLDQDLMGWVRQLSLVVRCTTLDLEYS